jgi:hypothetical protein
MCDIGSWIRTEASDSSLFLILKGETVSRDFRPLVFFRQTIPLGPLIHGLKRFQI